MKYPLIIVTAFILNACFPQPYKVKEPSDTLEQRAHFEENKVIIGSMTVNVSHTGNPNNPPVLFIHGSPGGWEAWQDYLFDEDLNERAYLVAPDRLGYGGSKSDALEPSLSNQAQAMIKTVEHDKKIIVVGHSYGGPVALRMAVDYPERIKALVLLAPAIDPDLEEARWYNLMANNALMHALLPSDINQSNQEIIPLKAQLVELDTLVSKVNVPVFVIQGVDDKLVPMGNAQYAMDKMANAEVDIQLLNDRGHFIPWEEYELVKQTIVRALEL